MSEIQLNAASQYLLTLAQRNAKAYAAMPNIRVIMLTGSAAEGVSGSYESFNHSYTHDRCMQLKHSGGAAEQ